MPQEAITLKPEHDEVHLTWFRCQSILFFGESSQGVVVRSSDIARRASVQVLKRCLGHILCRL
jgi:hypothetical protein